MGNSCGVASVKEQGIRSEPVAKEPPASDLSEKKKKDKKKKSRDKKRSNSSSSDSSSDSDSDHEEDDSDIISKNLLKEYLEREINTLTLELLQPEVVLKQLLEQKTQTTKALVDNAAALKEQQTICMREYQDLTNLQLLIQRKQHVTQEAWDNEQKEYVAAYSKHKRLEETHTNLENLSKELDVKVKDTSETVQKLLKLRKHQDNVLQKAFGGAYGSEKEAKIEEYVDKMREYRKNILNTKTQWLRGLDFTKQANMQYWRAIQVWTNIFKQHSPHVRLQYCAYVANYLHAAYTNSLHALNCMKAHTEIPYFSAKFFQEVDTSKRNTYNACQPRYHTPYLQWLWYYQQSAAYLEVWIQKTLSQTIEGDLIKVNGYLAVAEADLRAERKRLIIEKVKEKFGDDTHNEVAEQEAEVERLSKEVSKMQTVSIQTNVVTVSTGEEEVESSGQDLPPPAPKQQETSVGASAEELKEKEEEEEKKKQQVEQEAEQRLADARAKIAALESANAELERERVEAENARREAEEKRQIEAETAAARAAAEEAAANAAAEEKEQLLAEAEAAREAAEKAKEEAKEWSKLAGDAQAAHEASRIAAEEASRLAAEEAAEAARIEKEEAARAAEEVLKTSATPEEEKGTSADQEETAPTITQPVEEPVAPNFQSDIDSIMNDYKTSVEQYEKKRGTEEARMDLDLQEKLRARRKRRRQQMKQKLEEQKLLSQTQGAEEGDKS